VPTIAALAGDLPALLEFVGSASMALSENLRRSPAGAVGNLEVSVTSGAQAVEMAAPAWRSLEATEGATTAFQSLAVAKAMATAHHRRGEVPRIVVIRRAGRPVVVFPTVVTRWGGIRTVRFLGDPLIQYGDVIAAPDVSLEHLDAAWHAAADPSVASFAFLRKVRSDARIAPLLDLRTTIVAAHEAAEADTSQPYKAINARELRRMQRRLQERGEIVFDVLTGRAAQQATHEAIAMKRAWLADNASGPLRVARVCVGGQTAALEIGLLHEGRWCAFLGAMAPQFSKFGPGHVQMAQTIAHCHANGIASYDLLAPGDSYKSRIAHNSAAVRDYATSLSPIGWPSLCAARAIPGLKNLVARMAVSLMRTIRGSRVH